MKKLLAIGSLLMATACGIPSKVVSLQETTGAIFLGELVYSDGYSGVITVKNGPQGESFSGRFVVVDKSSVTTTQGTISSYGLAPSFGTVGLTSSSQIDASGVWHAVGNLGSSMSCDLQIGRGGHGSGICKHTNGTAYRISL